MLSLYEKEVARATGKIISTHTIWVDEKMSVEDAVCNDDMIHPQNFYRSDKNINSKNFPRNKKGKQIMKEISIFTFNKSMFSKIAISKMLEAEYKPATVWDLLALSHQKPKLQLDSPIVALGSVSRINKQVSVTYLSSLGQKRTLFVCGFAYRWHSAFGFVAVRI